MTITTRPCPAYGQLNTLQALYCTSCDKPMNDLRSQKSAALLHLRVMGAGAWDAHALSAVSQQIFSEVETGIRQMERVGLITRSIDDRYHCSPVARGFALSHLRQLGGEPLVRQARSVMAYQALRSALDITTFSRQAMLRDYLQDADWTTGFDDSGWSAHPGGFS